MPRFILLFVFFASVIPKPALAKDGLSASELAAASKIADSISTSELLGPMAPVALSPFFGIACLSGLAIFGESWIGESNALLGTQSPLRSHFVFFSFLTLAILTSLPKFTKVSKPFAQLVDQAEAYSGIIIILVIRFLARRVGADGDETPVLQAGFFEFTFDTLLMIAMGINIFVINAVKFFFEMLVWITPVPLIDAGFEVANKAICAGLMVIYGFSPGLATLVNLGLLAVCLWVFGWVHRQTVYYRTVLLEFGKNLIFPSKAEPTTELIVFPRIEIDPIPTKARCTLTVTNAGWVLKQKRWFRKPLEVEIERKEGPPKMLQGLFTNEIVFDADTGMACVFGHRFNAKLDVLASKIGISITETSSHETGAKAEFA